VNTTYLSHATIDNEILTVHERAFVTSKEQYCLSLFDRLSESARWEMNLATKAFGFVVTEPVLK